MLFNYRATTVEYDGLRSLLRVRMQVLDGRRWQLDFSECACMVLYAAEWWRREYEGGGWHWNDVFKSLHTPYDLPPLDRNEAMERGLRYWGHRPSDEGKRFFGAIVAQGGLPLRLVARGEGALSRLLRIGVRQAQLFHWNLTQLEAMLAAEDGGLVPHLRKPEIHRLLAEMIETVLALRDTHKLAGVAEPVQRLDDREPTWRERFPLAVDDRAARRLLAELVGEVAREVQVRAANACPVSVTRWLERGTDNDWRLNMKIAVPGVVSLDAIAQAVGLQTDAIPPAFGLELSGPTRRLPLGHGRRMIGQNIVRLPGTSRVLNGDDALSEWMLVLRTIGKDLTAPAMLPGAEALDAELPWIFACVDSDNSAELVAVGGGRISASRCMVVLPAGFKLRPLSPGGRVIPRDKLQGLDSPRSVWELHGACQADGPSASFRIQAGAIDSLTGQFLWRGTRRIGQSRPLAVWCGLPTLWSLDTAGRPARVDADDIAWKKIQPGSARMTSRELSVHRGPVDAWLFRGGELQCRFRMILIGNDAGIQLECGDSDREGVLTLHGWGVDSISTLSDMQQTVSISAGQARIELRSSAQRLPTQVDLALAWPGSSLSLRLTQPFPAAGGRFVGAEGQPLPGEITVSMRQLRGVSVHVVDLNPRSPSFYTLCGASIWLRGARQSG